ncbi:Zinc finger PHD-type [Penicillium expansum]|nr:Zinc finger PHD-type [Penicillium expansum]
MAPTVRHSISGRPSRSKPRSSLKSPNSGSFDSPDGPPSKKRKYVPGGPGGGGRFIDFDAAAAAAAAAAAQETPKKSTPRRHSASARSRLPREMDQPFLAPPPPPPIIPTTPPSMSRPRRDKNQTRGRFTSSTAAALALQQGDGYKPREERGWEEFHPDLDIDGKIAVFTSEEVDAPDTSTPILSLESLAGATVSDLAGSPVIISGEMASPIPIKRRPGRPPRRPEAILNALLAQQGQKIIPPPGPNPREKLTLPKPSFRLRDPFTFYEKKGVGHQNYVDRTMANVGYQESDLFLRHDRRFIRMTEGTQEDDLDVIQPTTTDGDLNTTIGRVEYDMDEQDEKWLEEYNAKRREDQLEPIKPAVFEITMTKIEREWHALEKRIPKPNPKPPQTGRLRSSSAAAVNGETAGPGEEQDSKCAICDDGDCENSNAIVFCDGCDLAVHQECYGVPFIPEGQWLCRKCQLLGRGSTNCIFCPNTEGAFKQTTSSKWAHLLCSFWIPEVSIGNPSLMEPVTDVEKVPRSRWKLNCYICKQRMGASIQCSNKNCFVAFHVSCARRAQLYLKMKIGHGLMDSHLLKAFCDKHVPLTGDWSMALMLQLPMPSSITAIPCKVDDGETARPQHSRWARRTLVMEGRGPHAHSSPYINTSLGRFTVRQRKQYAEDASKYWTLKREARRGAALLKRLQLQLETFSSMEMTRRDYVAMGVPGHKRLERRIEFGERLYKDLDRLRMLCDEVKKREREKLKDAEMLRNIVDLVYFPTFPLLWPIFEKAQLLDGKGVFAAGLMSIRQRLNERFYPSVAAFSSDLASLFTSEIGVEPAGDTAELQAQISGRAPELSLEQREKRKLAKRIIKVIQPSLEDAIRKESELNRKPFEKELKELDVILDHSLMSRSGDSVEPEGDTELSEELTPAEDTMKSVPTYYRHPTPVLTEQDQQLPLALGGIQWYMQPFDPVGTTVHEERWTGRDVMRGMSEELSELDEDELEGLKDLVDDGDLKGQATRTPAASQQNPRRTQRLRGSR